MEKIKQRLDQLELLMSNQTHLQDADSVIDAIESVDKFWPILTEEEKEFIGAVKFACKNQVRWE